MKFKSIDVVMEIIEEANDRFKELWKVNKNKLDELKLQCEELDQLIEEFDGEAFEVEVNEDNLSISMSVECNEIIIYSQDHKYYELIKKAKSITFSSINDSAMEFTFIFPGVWDRI